MKIFWQDKKEIFFWQSSDGPKFRAYLHLCHDATGGSSSSSSSSSSRGGSGSDWW